MTDEQTPYARFGGEAFFSALVSAFYAQVALDEVLRPMYPEDDLGPAEDRLRMFLEQYWGGPTTYSDLRGHPRLRMRHAPYVVDHDARERWLAAMTHAVNVTLPNFDVDEELTLELRTYFSNAALGMVNS